MSESKESKDESKDGGKIYNILLVGNPGVGKSTIGSSIANEPKFFESGLSWGVGKTKKFNWKELPDGNKIADTPGLADTELKKAAAEAITEALQKPATGDHAVYKILFVCTIESGRIRPADIATANIVMRAIVTDRTKIYHFVINKIKKKSLKKLLASQEAKLSFSRSLSTLKFPPTTVVFVPMDDEADDEDDAILGAEATVCNPKLEVTATKKSLLAVSQLLSPIVYEVKDVETVDVDDLKEEREKMEEEYKAREAVVYKNAQDKFDKETAITNKRMADLEATREKDRLYYKERQKEQDRLHAENMKRQQNQQNQPQRSRGFFSSLGDALDSLF